MPMHYSRDVDFKGGILYDQHDHTLPQVPTRGIVSIVFYNSYKFSYHHCIASYFCYRSLKKICKSHTYTFILTEFSKKLIWVPGGGGVCIVFYLSVCVYLSYCWFHKTIRSSGRYVKRFTILYFMYKRPVGYITYIHNKNTMQNHTLG